MIQWGLQSLNEQPSLFCAMYSYQGLSRFMNVSFRSYSICQWMHWQNESPINVYEEYDELLKTTIVVHMLLTCCIHTFYPYHMHMD